jgi:UDP-N-acetylglucosamine acyltransferase
MNQIHDTCILGGPAQSLTTLGNSKTAGFTLGRRNIIREFTCIHNSIDEKQPTCVGSDNYIMSHCTINHDVQISDRVVLSSGCSLGGHVVVMDGANLGMNSAVHQYVVVGAYTMIGMLAPVVKHVSPFLVLNPKFDHLYKINVVGMTRNGFSVQDITDVRNYYSKKKLGNMSGMSQRVRDVLTQFSILTTSRHRLALYAVDLAN